MDKTNLAFKCNYCNGGSDVDSMHYGYNGVCSKGVIEFNIKKAKYDWCSQPRSACNQYYKNKISYDQLKKIYESQGSVCYESAMINRWEASAGWNNKQGPRGITPRRIVNSEIGSLAILTLVTPNDVESNRRIFAMFLVDDYFEGDSENEGYVACNSKYKLHFTRKETNDLRFWDYYRNENSDGSSWSSGLFRYISDEQAAQILRQAVVVKKCSEDEELAREFFEHYCRIHGVKINEIPQPSGTRVRV